MLNFVFGYVLSFLGFLISDCFSYRVIVMVGVFIGVIGFFLVFLFFKLWMMYLMYGFMLGFGYRMIYNFCMVVIVDYFVRWFFLVVGIMMFVIVIGMFVMI